MDPSDVDSAEDIREHWDEWNENERLDALEAYIEWTLDMYGYDDDVEVESGDVPGLYTASYGDGTITIEPELLSDPDPEAAIHAANHEMVHAMNDQDDIDDHSYNDDDDFDFDEDDIESLDRHGEVGDIARELDHDAIDDGDEGSGGGGGGGSAGAGSGSDADSPRSDEVYEIDWDSGVWIETVDASGDVSIDIYFGEPAGW